jgi:hypothetical protein
MTRFPRIALFTVLVASALSAGCGDNVDDLAKARAARKPTGNKGTGAGDEAVVPVSNTGPGTTLPQPSGGGACQPAQVGSLDVKWRPPHALSQHLCTQQEANILASCFFANQGCDEQVTALCHQCAVSSAEASSTYGAIIVDESGQHDPEPNVEGCVAARSGDVSASGCGARLRSMFGCESQACAECDDANHAACTQAADTGVCATYAQAATRCSSQRDQCSQGSSPQEVAYSLIQLFCM